MRGIKSGKDMKQKIRGRAMSLKLKHKKLTYDEAKYLVLDEVFDELPDGAYFAAMAEHGMDADNIIELSESITEKGIKV